jgi:hypothetical protein
VHLDDVIVIGHKLQEHLLNLQNVFQWFREVCLKLNPEKCQTYCVTPESKKLKAVWEWPTPEE